MPSLRCCCFICCHQAQQQERGALLVPSAMFDTLSASLSSAFKSLNADAKLTAENMKVRYGSHCSWLAVLGAAAASSTLCRLAGQLAVCSTLRQCAYIAGMASSRSASASSQTFACGRNVSYQRGQQEQYAAA